MGPTATGKTELALEIASRFPVDIISVDAGQVYRGMDIGTAKPSRAVLQSVPHKLVDICSPWERYSAGQFRRDALDAIEQTTNTGRIPFLVGGTSFYFRALELGLSDLPSHTDNIGHALIEEAEASGWPHMSRKLMKIDPKAAKEISPNDTQRILRLLEIYAAEMKPPSEIKQTRLAEPLPFGRVKLAVVRADRDLQNCTIKRRFHKMLDCGLIQEAEQLFESPQFDTSLPSMRCVGYQQIWDYLAGKANYQSMVDRAIQETCGIAKRQLTWIRNQAGVIWTIVGDTSPADSVSRLMHSVLSN